MSLYEEFMTPCTLLVRGRTADNEGGWFDSWTDGETFDAAIVLNSTLVARMAEHDGMTGVFTVTTEPGIELGFHDVVRRESDGATFRVLKVLDSPPSVATFDFNQYEAEQWGVD